MSILLSKNHENCIKDKFARTEKVFVGRVTTKSNYCIQKIAKNSVKISPINVKTSGNVHYINYYLKIQCTKYLKHEDKQTLHGKMGVKTRQSLRFTTPFCFVSIRQNH